MSSTRLKSLDLDDTAVKDAYRKLTTWLHKHGVRHGAIKVWSMCGGDDATKPDLDTIIQNIRGLETILPVYVEAIVALCEEELGNSGDHPLDWWRSFVNTKLQPSWFATMYPRLPLDSMDTRKHDEEYYSLVDQNWAQIAGAEILQLDFMMAHLLATQGKDSMENSMMEQEIEIDEFEVDRQQAVFETVASNRLGTDADDYNPGISQQEVAKMFPDAQVDAGFFQSLAGVRTQRLLMNEVHTLIEDEYSMKAMTRHADAIVFQSAAMSDMKHSLEILRAGHALLKRDLGRVGPSGLHPNNPTTTREPPWMCRCERDVYELEEKDGMKFESKGVTETTSQKKGRAMRDKIYARFASLWDEDGHTWAKVPDESKIAIANAVGKAPLKWNPAMTARRLNNYIAYRRSMKGKTKLGKRKTAGSAKKDRKKRPTVTHIVCAC